MAEKIEIEVETKMVGDPEIPIFKITLSESLGTDSLGGTWEETYGSRELASAFLRGVEALSSFTGEIDIKIPSLPENPIY